MAGRARATFRDAHYWGEARSQLWCWLGEHSVTVGAWMRWRRGDVRRMAQCEACLAKREVFRPNRPFTSSAPDVIDNRQRRAGEV